MAKLTLTEARCIQYEFSISIRATRRRVWKGLIEQIDSWWLPDFRALGPNSVIALEPRAGGRLYERNGERELLWYTVLSTSPDESLDFLGASTADFGGPMTTMLSVRLLDEGTGTRATIRDSLFGQVNAEHAASAQAGWIQLFTEGLKGFVE